MALKTWGTYKKQRSFVIRCLLVLVKRYAFYRSVWFPSGAVQKSKRFLFSLNSYEYSSYTDIDPTEILVILSKTSIPVNIQITTEKQT